MTATLARLEPGHRGVVEELGRHEPGRLLDVPAGDSPVLAEAERLGYDVVGLDLFPSPTFRGVQGDACRSLPFRDERFDTVLSMEGIEHFEDQAGFLRECARVLRPGGRLILTTPNVLHLSARLSVFLTGQRTLKRGFVNEDQTLRGRCEDRIHHGHAFLIDVFRLRYLMAVRGLELVGLRSSRWSSDSILLSPIAPLVWAATRLSLHSGRRVLEREGRRAVRRCVEANLKLVADSPALLFCKRLIVVARKRRTPGERT